MSKIAVRFKSTTVSSLSKASQLTRPEYANSITPVAWHSRHLRRCDQSRSAASIDTLQDAFVGLLVRAGACNGHRQALRPRLALVSKHNTQCRRIASTAAVTEDETVVADSGNNFWTDESPYPEKSLSVRTTQHYTRDQPLSQSKPDPDTTEHHLQERPNSTPQHAKYEPMTGQYEEENKSQVIRSSLERPEDTPYDIFEQDTYDFDEYQERLPIMPASRYIGLVNTYGSLLEPDMPDGLSDTEIEELEDTMSSGPRADVHDHNEAQAQVYSPLAPDLTNPFSQEWVELPVLPRHRNPEQSAIRHTLLNLINEQLGDIQLSTAWHLLCQLPHPHVHHLPHRSVKRLFRHLCFDKFRDQRGELAKAQQLLNFCEAANIKLEVHQWTAVMSLIGRSRRRLLGEDVKLAIETWMKMERQGQQADEVTFTVLLTIALRARRFALAHSIQQEMEARDLPLGRYYRCAMISRAGYRKDGDGVREAFVSFVHNGEIVDTAVMNLVVKSLIDSGEGDAAEQVFMSMKQLHAEKFPAVSGDWKVQKRLAGRLDDAAAWLREEAKAYSTSSFDTSFPSKAQLEKIQQLAPVNPNVVTYGLVLRYHIYETGNIRRVGELLQEMREHHVRITGGHFRSLFSGFARHGGTLFSLWTSSLLEGVWAEFVTLAAGPKRGPRTSTTDDVDTVDDDTVHAAFSMLADTSRPFDADTSRPSDSDDMAAYFGVTVVKKAMEAFERCCGHQRACEIWAELEKHIGHRLEETEWREVRDKHSPDRKGASKDSMALSLRSTMT